MTWRMPAEWEPHERCVMAWPARAEMWRGRFRQAKHDYARVAYEIETTEPVLMVAPPGAGAEAREMCGGVSVEVVEWPIDDSWSRDTGAIVVVDENGRRAGVDFAFNSWGEKFLPYDEDARFARRMCDALGLERIDAAPFVLEGGGITVDGEGTLVTTEQCLLNPNRNPTLTRDSIETELRTRLGVETIVWLPYGIVEDDDTDGHVDNVCAFVAPGRVIAQTTSDRDDPNHDRLQRNVAVLKAAGLDVVELDVLPRTAVGDEAVVVPPLNAYVANRPGDRAGGRGRSRYEACPRDLARRVPGSRDHGRPGRGARLRWRRRPLHHPAGSPMTIRIISRAGQVPDSPARVDAPERAPFRVGAVQHRWNPDPKDHEAAIAEGVRAAAGEGAQLVCLQELTLSRYFAVTPDGPAAAGARPEPLPGGRTHDFAAALATELGIPVHASLYEAAVDRDDGNDGALGFNTAIVVAPGGALVARTRKLHIPVTAGYHEDRYFRPGNTGHPVVAIGAAHFGFPTCWDQWFPELARAYSLGGADVIVYPTAIGSEPDHPGFDTEPIWQQVITGNGIANGTFMIAVNRIGEEAPLRFYGSSFVTDPYGRVLVQAPRDEPAVIVADLDLDARRDWLALFPFLTTRRPDTYGPLTEMTGPAAEPTLTAPTEPTEWI